MAKTVGVPATYADRETGEQFSDARSMVNVYLQRLADNRETTIAPLDSSGYTQLKRGSAIIGVNVEETKGLFALLAPIMRVPSRNRESLYRRLLELSFLSTSDAAFGIDADKDEIYVRAMRRLSSLDFEEFEDLVETVGRVADEWDDVLAREFGRG